MVTIDDYPAEIVDCCPICKTVGRWVMKVPVASVETCLDVFTCPTCNCTYVSALMTKEAMDDFYSSGKYFNHVSEIRKDRGNFGERARAMRILVLLMSVIPEDKPTRALDVGCSQGHLLERLKDWSYGIETVGYDLYPDPDAVHEVVTDKSEVTGEFDLITCIHTLEHAYDPMAELEWMNSLLADGGVLLLELPTSCYIMLEHPITFSTDAVPVIMEHIEINNYVTMTSEAMESCYVLAKKSNGVVKGKSNATIST